jgi:hypothetical protein
MDSALVPLERRQARRTEDVTTHGIIAARVRPGHDALVLDAASDSALIETFHRLLPGASVELHLDTVHGRIAAKGRVVRCLVAAIDATWVRYRGAIRFDAAVARVTELHNGYQVPIPKSVVNGARWERTTRSGGDAPQSTR